MRRTRTLLLPALLALVALVTLAACSSDSDDSSSSTSSTTRSAASGATAKAVVFSEENGTLGRIVVDGQGRTVYTLTDAAGNAVTCVGSCLDAWPPVLLASGEKASGGSEVKQVAAATIPEGEQVTINGLPVYTFSGDAGPGDANGEGIPSFGGTWHVVKVTGGAAAGGGSTTTTTSDSGSGSDYDYSP